MTVLLPNYDQIPNVGLYLEQVTKYLNEYLEPLGCAPITGSMISNYVKKGLVPNPVKKQYDRERIAALLVIAVVKTVLSLEEVQQLLARQQDRPMEQVYADFCRRMPAALEDVFAKTAEDLLQDTVTVVAHKLYLDKRFEEEAL